MEIKCKYSKLAKVEELIVTGRNPNIHNDKQIQLLAKILKHQGWRNPIVMSKQSGFIVAGHARLEAAKINGWTEVPIDIQDFENEADEYAHMVADNKIAELADMDLSMVNEDFVNFGPDFNIDLLGIPNFKIDLSEKEIKEKEIDELETKNCCPSCGYEW